MASEGGGPEYSGRGGRGAPARPAAVPWDDVQPRGRGWTWPERSLWSGPALQQLRAWAALEARPGRLWPWLPVAFGVGIALYFAANREPQWWAGVSAALVGSVIALRVRARALPFVIAVAGTTAAAGFSAATLHSWTKAHPVLTRPAFNVSVTGFVEMREERERTDRIVVRVASITGERLEQQLERVRVSVKKGTAPPVGSAIAFRARLSPPLEPLRPGGYDFARDLYFQRIGATGFALGAVRQAEGLASLDLSLRYAATLQSIRDGLDARIRAVLTGDRGAIASALITGKRDAITKPVNDAMYVSSLAHVLSISGYHMAVVAGAVFFVLRALLALVPALGIRRAIKKWAAAGALLASFGYLLLSGSEVATQRAFIMTAVVLVGVMCDRPALTLRTLAIAALVVLMIAPQAVVHPSFQMSFAATLALVAVYERGLPWMSRAGRTSWGARMALWGGREIVALLLASLVAGLATMPYAAFHFHRAAPYGVLANLAAMPVVSGWVMPMGLLALLAAPFGYDGVFWGLMGQGIDWMITVAMAVAALPGSVGQVPAFGIGVLVLGSAGLLLLCLLRSPLRWSGGVVAVAALALALSAERPQVLVSADGNTVAARGADGRLQVHRIGSDSFAIREWLAADADPRTADDRGLGAGFRCDSTACVGGPEGAQVSHVMRPEAFEEDCALVAIIVTARDAPPNCKALVLDRAKLRAEGAAALYRDGETWRVTRTRPVGEERPWAPARTQTAPRPAVSPSAQQDATPHQQDLEADDGGGESQ